MNENTYRDVVAAAAEQSLAGLKQIQDANVQVFTAATASLPSPSEFLTAGFDAAAQLLEQQRVYALRVAELFGSSTTD